MLRITGGQPLHGKASASGSKNAALPILAASILADGPVTLTRVPRLTDVDTLAQVLTTLGMRVRSRGHDRLRLETVDDRPVVAPASLVDRMRASFCVLGPLLARRGRAVVALPGGCRIGRRPVDLHLRGLAALGAEIRVRGGYVHATARRLRAAHIDLRGPRGTTVTGTANTMMAACLARGTSVLAGAAREPEIVDLGRFLNSLGADIRGLGSGTLRIRGVARLSGGSHEIIPDRIEAATLLLAAAVTGGSVTVTDLDSGHLAGLLPLLHAAGCQLHVADDRISLTAADLPCPVDFVARPFPGLASDLQAPWTVLAALATGRSTVRDDVFPRRFAHLKPLRQMGLHTRRVGASVNIEPVARLHGADVTATDLRAGAALVLAGLAAEGVTTVRRMDHVDRGYERLDEKLARLGARIERSAEQLSAVVVDPVWPAALHESSLVG